MKPHLGLRMGMLIVAGCALVLAVARSDWATDWGGYLLVVSLVGLLFGALGIPASFLLLALVSWKAPGRRRPGRDAGTEPHVWVWAGRGASRRAIRLAPLWPPPLKRASWSCCAALGLVVLLDLASGGHWWDEGAPGAVGWRAHAVSLAGVIFAVATAWTWFASPSAQ